MLAVMFRQAFRVLFFLAGLLCLPAIAVAESGASAVDPPVTQLIVKLAAGESRPSAEILAQELGVRVLLQRSLSDGADVLALPTPVGSDEAQRLAAQVAALSRVEYAQVDHWVFPDAVAADALHSLQWYEHPVQDDPAAPNFGINAVEAWDAVSGDARLVLAVIDTGLLPHLELTGGRVAPGFDFITDAARARDGDGRDADPTDPGDYAAAGECGTGAAARASSWHGTHVAGILAAAGNNGIGIAGVDWKSQILPVRVLGRCGGPLSDILDGMRWAAGLPVPGVPMNPSPARILNLSLGAPQACGAAAQRAVDDVNATGALVVVSAGNDSRDVSGVTPAGCAGVVTVAATGRDGQRAAYSNVGRGVAVAAPGGDPASDSGILSTGDSGSRSPAFDSAYLYKRGTSMAAPQVAAVAALVWSRFPQARADDIVAILREAATPFPAYERGHDCRTETCGAGILNAAAAVRLAGARSQAFVGPAPAVAAPAPATSAGGAFGPGMALFAALRLVLWRKRRRHPQGVRQSPSNIPDRSRPCARLMWKPTPRSGHALPEAPDFHDGHCCR